MAKVSVVLRDGRVKQMAENYAKVLIRLGRASLVAETPEKSKPAAKTPRTPSTKPADKSSSKRVYRRRDLQAEE